MRRTWLAIVQMTADEYIPMLKLYNIEPVTSELCTTIYRTPELRQSISWFNKTYFRGCVEATEGKIHPFRRNRLKENETVTTLILSCIGTARMFNSEDMKIYFYWEEFPDGEGFIGYTDLERK